MVNCKRNCNEGIPMESKSWPSNFHDDFFRCLVVTISFGYYCEAEAAAPALVRQYHFPMRTYCTARAHR